MIYSELEGKNYDIETRNNKYLEFPKIERNEEINKMIENADTIKLSGDWHLWEANRKEKLIRRGHRLDKTIEECKKIKENDLLIFLGDLVDDEFEDEESVERVLNLIKGKKIMILGNNDLFNREFYERNFDVVVEGFQYKDLIFTHFPLLDLTEEVNLHGHIHTSSYYHPERCTKNINVFTESGEFISFEDLEKEINEKRK